MGDPKAPAAIRRRLVEEQCCIDVSALYKTGKLRPGTCSVWSWSRGSGIDGAVHLVADADAIEMCGYISTWRAFTSKMAERWQYPRSSRQFSSISIQGKIFPKSKKRKSSSSIRVSQAATRSPLNSESALAST
jgi:hypothetical protein